METVHEVLDITMMVRKPTNMLHVGTCCCLQRVVGGGAVERKQSIGKEYGEA